MSDIKAQANLDIGKVVEQTFQSISRNIVVYGVLAVALGAAPTLLFGLISAGSVKALAGGGNSDAMMAAASGLSVYAPFQFLVSMALHAGLIFCAFEDISGRVVAPADVITKMLRTVLPLIGLTLLQVIATMLGLVLLIVPAFMMICAWVVTSPALVIEGQGVFASFSRSAMLTRGVRWRVFALLAIYTVISGLISAVSSAVLIGGGRLNVFQPNIAASLTVPVMLFNSAVKSIYAVVTAVGGTVLFVQLRQSREGTPKDQVLDVFS
jgi:hypothetical protein